MDLGEGATMDAGLVARGLIETAPTLLYIYDLIGDRNLYISPQCEAMLGYTPKEIAAHGPLAGSLFHPEDVDKIKAHHARIVAEGSPDGTIHAVEYRMRHRDGGWRWFASRETVHRRDDAGTPTQILGAALDVTDRIPRERLAEQTAETFSLLVRHNPFGIYIVDADFRIVEHSEGARKTFATVQPVIGRDLAEVLRILWPEPFASEAIARFRHTLATGEPFVAVGTVETRRDIGEQESYDWRVTRITLPDGRPGVVCHFYDLSERNSYQAALEEGARRLRESEERLRLAQDYAGIGSWAWDHVRNRGDVSPSYRRLHGFAPDEELTREKLLEVMHPDDRPAFVAAVARAVSHGARMEVEYRITLPDGEVRWIRGVGQAVEGGPLPAELSMGTVEDITARKRVEERLREKEERLERINLELEARVKERTASLERANAALSQEILRREAVQTALVQSQKLEALGQLTSGIAHDFNNVIAAISGGFAIIERRSTDPRILDVARHGVAAAERGGKLVRQLTAFARQEVLRARAVQIGDVIAQTEPLLRRSAGDAQLFIDCPGDLPLARIDPTFLEAALLNLIINARDATEGAGKIGVAARISQPGEPGHAAEMAAAAVRIDVTDNGCGMPADVLARALDPFFTTKEPGRGTGLGLAMVHGFVHQSGGALAISSVVGRGTRVTLFVPIADEDEADTGGEAPHALPAGRALPSLRIVLAEDDDEVRMMVGTLLRDWGHAVFDAADADSALRLVETHGPHLLLTDVRMPGRDGIALAADIRHLRPDLPVLFMTGHADRARLGGERVLDKPFSIAELAQAIADLCPAVQPDARGAAAS